MGQQQNSALGGPLNVVGKRGPNIDAVERVTGRAKYTGDLSMPGMLTARILRSTRPHARIVNIDTSKAEALPGVRAVITYKDAPKVASDNVAQADSADAVDLVSSLELSLGDSKRPRPARHRTHKRVRRLLVQLAMLVKALRKLPIEIGRAHV